MHHQCSWRCTPHCFPITRRSLSSCVFGCLFHRRNRIAAGWWQLQTLTPSNQILAEPSDGTLELLQHYNTTLCGFMDKHASLVTKEVIVRSNAPLLTENITAAGRLRREVERRRYTTKLTITLDIYTSILTGFVDYVCRTAKSACYQAEIERDIDNPKALFRITESFMNKTTKWPEHHVHKIRANGFVCFSSGKIRIFSKCFGGRRSYERLERSRADSNRSIGVSYWSKVPELIFSGNSKCCDLDPVPTRLLEQCLYCLLLRWWIHR